MEYEVKVGDVVHNDSIKCYLVTAELGDEGLFLLSRGSQGGRFRGKSVITKARESEINKFKSELKDVGLMISKDGESIVKWMPEIGKPYWSIHGSRLMFEPYKCVRLKDDYSPFVFATQKLARKASVEAIKSLKQIKY